MLRTATFPAEVKADDPPSRVENEGSDLQSKLAALFDNASASATSTDAEGTPR